MESNTKKLSAEQLSQFDRDLMEPNAKKVFWAQYDKHFGRGAAVSILDVGGGNGTFADMLLRHLPQARVAVLDNSAYLLRQNVPSDRKSTLCGSAENLAELFPTERFDLITINWVLHHLVGRSRKETALIIENVLRQARMLLRPGGRVAVFENVMDGVPVDEIPNRIIYAITSCRIPLVTPLIRRHAFNTAGVGVFFMSDRMLHRFFAEAGLEDAGSQVSDEWRKTRLFRMALMLRSIRVTNYWLKSKN